MEHFPDYCKESDAFVKVSRLLNATVGVTGDPRGWKTGVFPGRPLVRGERCRWPRPVCVPGVGYSRTEPPWALEAQPPGEVAGAAELRVRLS